MAGTEAANSSDLEIVFCCKFKGCTRTYVSTDGVRKHCRKHHPEWLAQLDEIAREERTHNRSELYCNQKKMTRSEIEHAMALEPRKRQRRNLASLPTDLKIPLSAERGSPSPTFTEADGLPSSWPSSPQEAAPSIWDQLQGADNRLPPLQLEEESAFPIPPPTFFSLALPPLKRGASLADLPEQSAAVRLDADTPTLQGAVVKSWIFA